MTKRRVAIVGGGMAGLTAAFELTRLGLQPIVLEAGALVGGAVRSHTVDGITLDAGAESFAVSRPAVGQLIDDLGLADAIVQPNRLRAWVRHQAGTSPLPAGALLGIPGRPDAADVRAVIGTVGVLRARLDRALPPQIGGSTVGELVARRLGSRVLHRLVEPVVGGVYSTDPYELDVDTVAPGLLAALGRTGSLSAAVRQLRPKDADRTAPGGLVAGLAGGMSILPLALAKAITTAGGEIRCDTATSGIELLPPGTGRWRVHAGGSVVDVDAVMVATPAGAAAPLLAPVLGADPFTGQNTATTPVALVTMVANTTGLASAPRGTGVLVARRAAGINAKALTQATAKWKWLAETAGPDRHVMRLSFGRGGDDCLPPDDRLVELAIHDAADLLGIVVGPQAIRATSVVHWDSALPRPGARHLQLVAELRGQLGAKPGLAMIGTAMAGTGLAAVVADARITATSLAGKIH